MRMSFYIIEIETNNASKRAKNINNKSRDMVEFV